MSDIMPLASWVRSVVPGTALCSAIAIASVAIQSAEVHFTGFPYIEALVIAIILGAILRAFWTPGPAWRAGIAFSAKTLLEIAVMLLGASLSAAALAAAGIPMLVGILAIVVISLAFGYGVGRLFGLPHTMSLLMASGNSICGNSAIAAVAAAIDADGDDVVSSIGFTAVLGLVVVLSLPALIPAFHLTPTAFGTVAGLTVYAVPQVLAATAPAGLLSTQVGTLVKLVRVLMLGPVVVFAALTNASRAAGGRRPTIGKVLPWFIVGFAVLAALRSMHLVPEAALPPIGIVTHAFTLAAMAALGLGVDIRVLRTVGWRAMMTVTVSLVLLLVLSLALVAVLKP
jgi:uncharacterized integral membrane protein (TIGR00698 family)